MFANSKMRENCGRLIKVYREMRHASSKDHQYNCSEFILATREHPFFEVAEGQPVCSRATLNRMERGLSVRDDELYEFFIGKLGFRASEFPGVIEQAEKLGEELYSAVELYDVSKIEQLDKQIDTLFEKARNYFYYNEVYTALKTVTDYYLNVIYPKNSTADQLLMISFILDEDLEELVLNVLFDHFYYRDFDMVKAEKTYERLSMCSNRLQISSLFISGWSMYKERWFTALNVIDNALAHFQDKQVDFYLGVLYFTKAMALYTGNKENVEYYFTESIKYLERTPGKLARVKLVNNYFNVGFYYYFDRNYQQAIVFFKKFLENKPSFSVHMLYILHCTEETKCEEMFQLLQNIDLGDRSCYQINDVFFRYFKMKLNHKNEKYLENFILNEVKEVLATRFRSDNLIAYFENELSKIAKITKHYKSIASFNNFISHKID